MFPALARFATVGHMNPPSDIDAERAVLGAIILDNSKLKEVLTIISASDFFGIGNMSVFSAMLSCAEDGTPIDAVTVYGHIHDADKASIKPIDLSTLADNIGAPSMAPVYAKRIKACSVRRDGILAAERMIRVCASDNINQDEISKLTQKFHDVEIVSGSKKTKTKKLSHGVGDALTGLKKFASGDNSDRVQIGISKIDWSIRGGMMDGALYLVGASTGGGKTTMMQSTAVLCARTRGPVLFVSPEMATHELSEREIIRVSGVSMNGRGPWVQFSEEKENEALHIRAACEIEKENLEIHCVDGPSTMADTSEIARSIEGLRLIIIDYAQEVADMDPRVARYLAVGAVGSDAIKIGKELGCPVMVASQVNKSDKGIYKFRESGDLENRSHVAMIIESKKSETPNENGYFDIESTRIFSPKNRSGPLFSIPVNYEPALYRIGNFEQRSNVWTPKERNTNGGEY